MRLHRPSGIRVTNTEVEVYGDRFPERSPEAHRALMSWCEFHDIDPYRVPMLSVIVRNIEACRVEYDEIVLGFDGTKATVQDGDDLVLVTRRVHTQGATPPLPWPPEVWEAAR